MPFDVVCISREVGAGGEDVGRIVAERLGLRYVDEEVVALAAERGQVESGAVADAEQRRSRLDRVLRLMGDVGVVSGMIGAEPIAVREAREQGHRQLIRDVLEEIGGRGNAVIVAHAASMALAGREGVLRVMVTGTPEARARRLAESSGEEEAARLVRDGDEARAQYLRRFYDVDQELSCHYDVAVCTDVLTPEQAAEVVLSAAAAAAA
jgi:Cytidylate kinase-like family